MLSGLPFVSRSRGQNAEPSAVVSLHDVGLVAVGLGGDFPASGDVAGVTSPWEFLPRGGESVLLKPKDHDTGQASSGQSALWIDTQSFLEALLGKSRTSLPQEHLADDGVCFR